MAQSRSPACDLLSGESGSKENRREERRGGGRWVSLSKESEEMKEICVECSRLSRHISVFAEDLPLKSGARISGFMVSYTIWKQKSIIVLYKEVCDALSS